MDPALDPGELARLGRRLLGEPERGGAGDQGAEHGVEGVVGVGAGLARALPPLSQGAAASSAASSCSRASGSDL